MENIAILTAIITAIFTALNSVFLIVYIARQNDLIKNMKSYMDIFKVDEVKKYVEMKEEISRSKHLKEIEELKEKIDRESKGSENYKNLINRLNKKLIVSLHDAGKDIGRLTTVLALIIDKPDRASNPEFIRRLKMADNSFPTTIFTKIVDPIARKKLLEGVDLEDI